MRYFNFLYKASFSTTAEGQRLFHLWGALSWPYIVPDAITESRLLKRLFWTTLILLAVEISALICLFRFTPHDMTTNPIWLGGILAAIVALNWIAWHLAFRNLLRTMSRALARPSLRNHFQRTSQAMPIFFHIVGLLASITMIVASIFVISRHKLAIGVTSLVFFGIGGIVIGYGLILKCTTRRLRADQR